MTRCLLVDDDTEIRVSLPAQKVYTLFMMGDAAAPIAVLRKDR
jgi:hypothetical protein